MENWGALPTVLKTLVLSYLHSNICGKESGKFSVSNFSVAGFSFIQNSVLTTDESSHLFAKNLKDLCIIDPRGTDYKTLENFSCLFPFDIWQGQYYGLTYEGRGAWKIRTSHIDSKNNSEVSMRTFRLRKNIFCWTFRVISNHEIAILHGFGLSIHSYKKDGQVLEWVQDLCFDPLERVRNCPHLVWIEPYLYYIKPNSGRIRGWRRDRNSSNEHEYNYQMICDCKTYLLLGPSQICGYGEELFVAQGCDILHFLVDIAHSDLHLLKSWKSPDQINSLCFWHTAEGGRVVASHTSQEMLRLWS